MNKPSLDSRVVNDAAWAFVQNMPHKLPAEVFNDLKPALYAAFMYYHDQVLATVQTGAVTEALPGELLALACWLDAQVLHWQAVRGLPDDDEEVRALRKWARMIRAASPTPDEQRAQAAQEDVRLLKAIRAEAAGYFGYDMRDHKTASDQAFELFGKSVAEQLRTALAGRQQQ